MRRALAYRPSAQAVAVVVTLLAFVAWGAWRVVPFLHSKPAEIYATPTTQPTGSASLAPVPVPGKGGQACVNNIAYGPGAKYVFITVQSAKYRAGALTIDARAPGYSASVQQPAGLQGGDLPVIVKIAPATREVDGGTLCVRNHGRHRVGLYGIPPGRGSSPTTTTVDGHPVTQQLSVTLLTSPSASLGSRLGTIFDHAAAFRPVTGWEIWVLALLVGIGAPIALALALAGAVAEDELPPPE
jgi:hypothetical protein